MLFNFRGIYLKFMCTPITAIDGFHPLSFVAFLNITIIHQISRAPRCPAKFLKNKNLCANAAYTLAYKGRLASFLNQPVVTTPPWNHNSKRTHGETGEGGRPSDTLNSTTRRSWTDRTLCFSSFEKIWRFHLECVCFKGSGFNFNTVGLKNKNENPRYLNTI